jgi:hypothetical protein
VLFATGSLSGPLLRLFFICLYLFENCSPLPPNAEKQIFGRIFA